MGPIDVFSGPSSYTVMAHFVGGFAALASRVWSPAHGELERTEILQGWFLVSGGPLDLREARCLSQSSAPVGSVLRRGLFPEECFNHRKYVDMEVGQPQKRGAAL
jgi:hypothetical protein